MRVKIDRNVCTAQLSFCERCLGKFLREPMGYERHCFEEIVDDGSPQLTVEIHSGDHTTILVLNEEQRLQAAAKGWSYFVDFIPPMYRDDTANKA
jgi:hypothetical protein